MQVAECNVKVACLVVNHCVQVAHPDVHVACHDVQVSHHGVQIDRPYVKVACSVYERKLLTAM